MGYWELERLQREAEPLLQACAEEFGEDAPITQLFRNLQAQIKETNERVDDLNTLD